MKIEIGDYIRIKNFPSQAPFKIKNMFYNIYIIDLVMMMKKFIVPNSIWTPKRIGKLNWKNYLIMKLKGKYEIVVEIELPDDTYTPVSNLVDFCLESNYMAVDILSQYPDTKYFDLNGCLDTLDNYHWIRNYFIRVGYINDNDEILDCQSIIYDLHEFKGWAREYENNKKQYERNVKIDILND